MAEELFGKRDESFTVTGIEFWKGGPRISYPDGYSTKKIIIKLGDWRQRRDLYRSRYSFIDYPYRGATGRSVHDRDQEVAPTRAVG